MESIITISIAGLLAGFVFAMPIAGPVSIMITSNALKGRLRYSYLVSLGASFADFTFVFIAVFGLTKLYSFYTPVMPYMFAGGAILFIFLGYRIWKTKIDIEQLDDRSPLVDKIKKKGRGAFYTGLMINFLNPTLFIGALTSSFFVISLIASLGFHTGGLAAKIGHNVNEINIIEGGNKENSQPLSLEQFDFIKMPERKVNHAEPTEFPAYFHLLISFCYSFFLSAGSILWFFLLAYLIVRFRQRINIKVIAVIIKSLGVVLGIVGLYFGYLAAIMLF